MIYKVEVFQKGQSTLQSIVAKDHLAALGYAFKLFDGVYMASVEFDYTVNGGGEDYVIPLHYVLTRNGYLSASFVADIPDDCEEDAERRFSMAVDMARQALPEHVTPCEWSLILDTGNEVTVCRESRYQVGGQDD